MATILPGKEAKALKLFQHRNMLLTAIREHSLCDPEEQSQSFIFQHCCNMLVTSFDCSSVWAGEIDKDQCRLTPLAASPPATLRNSSAQHRLARILTGQFGSNLSSFTEPFYLDTEKFGQKQSEKRNCVVLPVRYRHCTYGFVAMHCQGKINFCDLEKEFIAHVIDDIALALFSQETVQKLKIELDFNKEIVDTIQALMITIHPCGTILSFNKRAEELTGYKEHEVFEKYWVDTLISPDKRIEFQQLFSTILKGARTTIDFKAPLLTKNGKEHHISWHGSIRHNIEKGKIGLVMLGIDETENLAAGQQLNKLTARWEKIFIAIQDPALVVSNDSVIIDANPATFASAKKHRDQVIGKKVCDILHGGQGCINQCPLEQLIGYQKTHISETELHGLHGTYMLTVSPLLEEKGGINATLLVAHNLTQEEVIRAAAIRAAQLAAIGELASGVAHEINNPINGIINYAQIILDDPNDPESADNLRHIIAEGKRIADIVSNLLDFARRREGIAAPSQIGKIVSSSLQLVAHLLKKDGIVLSVNIAENLPPLTCNEQQLQQVVLNMISNARYALNMRHPQSCPEKQLEIEAKLHEWKKTQSIRLTFTDHGIGIAPEIQKRLFDPFFSTKPKGEGTGLGLSISHGLVRDHGGYIKVQSEQGEWSRFVIDLPLKQA